MEDFSKEIKRRRTFAIISHPDAGKTTLTEKLLLYGGFMKNSHYTNSIYVMGKWFLKWFIEL